MSEHDSKRRRFLTAGATAAGALIVGTKSQAAEPTPTNIAPPPAELSLSLKSNPTLTKIGGSAVLEVGEEKIIVAHVAAETFAACSAICTHKGCVVEYVHAAKHFVCPCHGARFSLDGKVVQGPAKKPLRSYSTDTAALVSIASNTAEKKVS